MHMAAKKPGETHDHLRRLAESAGWLVKQHLKNANSLLNLASELLSHTDGATSSGIKPLHANLRRQNQTLTTPLNVMT